MAHSFKIATALRMVDKFGQVSPSTDLRTVKHLSARKYVAKVAGERIKLTPLGRAYLDKANNDAARADRAAINNFDYVGSRFHY